MGKKKKSASNSLEVQNAAKTPLREHPIHVA